MNPRYTVKISGREFLVSMNTTLQPVYTDEETRRLEKLQEGPARKVSKKRAKYLGKRGERVYPKDGQWFWEPGFSWEYKFVCPKCGCCMFNTSQGGPAVPHNETGRHWYPRAIGHCKGGTFNNDTFTRCGFEWARISDDLVFRAARRYSPWNTPTDKKFARRIKGYGKWFEDREAA